MSSPQNYPWMSPQQAQQEAHKHEMMAGAAAQRAAQQQGGPHTTSAVRAPVRLRRFRGWTAVIIAAAALIQGIVFFTQRQQGYGIFSVLICVAFLFAARRFLRPR